MAGGRTPSRRDDGRNSPPSTGDGYPRAGHFPLVPHSDPVVISADPESPRGLRRAVGARRDLGRGAFGSPRGAGHISQELVLWAGQLGRSILLRKSQRARPITDARSVVAPPTRACSEARVSSTRAFNDPAANGARVRLGVRAQPCRGGEDMNKGGRLPC